MQKLILTQNIFLNYCSLPKIIHEKAKSVSTQPPVILMFDCFIYNSFQHFSFLSQYLENASATRSYISSQTRYP